MSEKIYVYCMSDGKEWADFLLEKFNCEEYNISTIIKDFNTADPQPEAKVNLFLITPDATLLDNWNYMNYFDSEISLAVLTGIDHEDWSLALDKCKINSLNNWYLYELDEEEDSVRELIILVISLYENKQNNFDDTYANIPADADKADNTKRVLLPTKQSTSSFSEEVFTEIDTDIKADVDEFGAESDVRNNKQTAESDDDIYKVPSIPRPLNSVRYVFRKEGQIYVLLEDTNNGIVQIKFHRDEKLVNASCVSVKTTVYTFPHTCTDLQTFDVLLDGKEVGYGMIEKVEEPNPKSSEDDYDLPLQERFRESVISVQSTGSSSISSRSSNASNFDLPPPCRPAPNKYTNMSRSPSDTLETPVTFGLPPPSPSNSFCPTGSDLSTSTAMPKNFSSSRKSSAGTLSKLDKIHKLLEDVTDPVDILCQSLQAENLMHLDEKMAAMLQETESLKSLPFESSIDAVQDSCDSVCPTLMHFGAKYNLKIFCLSLLKNPLTRDAAIKRNKDGWFPHDVARAARHEELANDLENASRQIRSSKTISQDSGYSQRSSLNLPPPPPPHSVNVPASSYIDMNGTVPLQDRTQSIKSKTGSKNNSLPQTASTRPPTPPPHSRQRSTYIDMSGTIQTLVQERTSSLKSQRTESGTRLKSSQDSFEDLITADSLTEMNYEVPLGREGSISSTGSGSILMHRLSTEEEFDEIKDDGEDFEDASNLVQGICVKRPINRQFPEESRTNRKNLRSILGDFPSHSVPNEIYLPQEKKQGMLSRITQWKKDKSRMQSEPKIKAEELDVIHGPRPGAKTLIHKKEYLFDGEPASEQFRSRLQTYPGPGQTLARPNLKDLKHRPEKELSSSIPDLVGVPPGGIGFPSLSVSYNQSPNVVRSAPSSPRQRTKEHHFFKWGHDPSHGSSDISARGTANDLKEVTKRDKKKDKKKEKKKQKDKKIEVTITKAQKRRSMRLQHARKAPVDSAPPLPPRPKHMKQLIP